MSLLTYTLVCPLLAALALIFVPRNYRFVMRLVTLGATLISMLLAVGIFLKFDNDLTSFQFVQKIPWVDGLGISYHVGVDGISVCLVLLAAVVGFAAACVSWEIQTSEKEYYILLLVMTGGIIGAFASLDIFMLYFFHELALVPTFIMIGLWGRGERKNYATFQITLYLSVGALIALIGLIALYVQSGVNSFDLVELTAALQKKPLSLANQEIIFPLLLFGFGILVSLWPFHTWAPLGYASAPTATAMLHAGVLKKFGLYGLIRIAIPMMPDAAQSWMNILAWLCVGNIVYCGWVAMRQRDLNMLIGNSSVAHMGFAFLGIASLSLIGLTGTVLVMVAHGFLAALTFALSGYLHTHLKTLNMDKMGGLLQKVPFIGSVMIMAMMAGCGVPGFANFPGELMVMFGSWKGYTFITTLAVWGALVIAGVYMLRAIRDIWHGPLSEVGSLLPDAGAWRKVPFVLLLGILITFGCFPRLLTEKIHPSARQMLEPYEKAKAPPATKTTTPARP